MKVTVTLEDKFDEATGQVRPEYTVDITAGDTPIDAPAASSPSLVCAVAISRMLQSDDIESHLRHFCPDLVPNESDDLVVAEVLDVDSVEIAGDIEQTESVEA